jgi:hypothetical protein
MIQVVPHISFELILNPDMQFSLVTEVCIVEGGGLEEIVPVSATASSWLCQHFK